MTCLLTQPCLVCIDSLTNSVPDPDEFIISIEIGQVGKKRRDIDTIQLKAKVSGGLERNLVMRASEEIVFM